MGERKILNGLSCNIEILKWLNQPDSSTFDKLSDNLGNDTEGNVKFINRIDHLTKLFGKPDKTELKKYGSTDLGVVEWTRNKVRVAVTGISIFSNHYTLYVGLIDNSHDRDLKNGIDKLKAQGLTEEELGK